MRVVIGAVRLERQHMLGDEGADLEAERVDLGRKGKVHDLSLSAGQLAAVDQDARHPS